MEPREKLWALDDEITPLEKQERLLSSQLSQQRMSMARRAGDAWREALGRRAGRELRGRALGVAAFRQYSGRGCFCGWLESAATYLFSMVKILDLSVFGYFIRQKNYTIGFPIRQLRRDTIKNYAGVFGNLFST